jgi:hypothetical protein
MGMGGEVVSDPGLGCEIGGCIRSLGGNGRVVGRGFRSVGGIRGVGVFVIGGEENVSDLEFGLVGMLGQEFGDERLDEGVKGIVAARGGI